MFEFIAARLWFWAVIVLWSLIILGGTLGLLFSKLEDRLNKTLMTMVVTLFASTGIIGCILFLVALTIISWSS